MNWYGCFLLLFPLHYYRKLKVHRIFYQPDLWYRSRTTGKKEGQWLGWVFLPAAQSSSYVPTVCSAGEQFGKACSISHSNWSLCWFILSQTYNNHNPHQYPAGYKTVKGLVAWETHILVLYWSIKNQKGLENQVNALGQTSIILTYSMTGWGYWLGIYLHWQSWFTQAN